MGEKFYTKEHKIENTRVECEIVFTNIIYPKDLILSAGTWVSAKAKITKILKGMDILQEFGIVISPNVNLNIRNLPISVRGNICQFDSIYDIGKSFKIVANVVEDNKYGVQFDILFICSLDKLTDKDSQYKFLSTVLSSSQLDLLYKSCNDPFKIIEEENIEALMKIKGVGSKKALSIIEKFKRSKDNSQAYIKLFDLGLTKNRIDKLVEEFHSPDTLVEIIESNPYKLIELASGFGWKTADTLALNSGIHPMSSKRIEAYIYNYLQVLGYGNEEDSNDLSGSTWVELTELLDILTEEFKDDAIAYQKELNEKSNSEVFNLEDFLLECIIQMLKKNNKEDEKEKPRLKMVKVNSGTLDAEGNEIIIRKIALYKNWELEQNIAIELMRIQNGKLLNYKNPEESIQKAEQQQSFEFTDEQKEGIYTVLNNQVSIVTGKSGSGKTSVITGMLAALSQYSKELTAFSGQASSRLSDVTHCKGKTVHRLLRYVPNLGFLHNEENPLNTNMVILDETGMMPLDLFYALLKAIPTGTKLIMTGDFNQLPPIGLGSLLRDLIESNVIPKVILTKIHRQSAKSGIITESLKVSEGKQLTVYGKYIEETRGELQDFKIITYEEKEDTLDNILNEFKRLYFDEQIPIDKIQIITPLRQRGNLSTNYINPIIQEMVNPANNDSIVPIEFKNTKGEIEYSYNLKRNDKIRINKNTYRGVFEKEEREESPIFNGNLGTIENIDLSSEEINADLGYMGKFIIPKGLWKIINLSYASSCHSTQGSEFPYVIVALDNTAYTLLNRNWLYTAITRAKKYCVLIAQEKALRTAISKSATDNKRTFLKDMLIEQKKIFDEKKKEQENEIDIEYRQDKEEKKPKEIKIDWDKLRRNPDDQNLDQYGNDKDFLPF